MNVWKKSIEDVFHHSNANCALAFSSGDGRASRHCCLKKINSWIGHLKPWPQMRSVTVTKDQEIKKFRFNLEAIIAVKNFIIGFEEACSSPHVIFINFSMI